MIDFLKPEQKKGKQFQLKFRLENVPGIGTLNMVAGECDADTPVTAGKMMEDNLKRRIGEAKYKYLAEAKIVDAEGRDRAFLQIDQSYVKATNSYIKAPSWGHWLNVF
jgi:hypothetical protein